MNAELAQRINSYLAGSCNSEHDAAEQFDVTEDEVLQAVSDFEEIERCTTCSWWCELDELVLQSDEYTCLDCKEDSLDEETE